MSLSYDLAKRLKDAGFPFEVVKSDGSNISTRETVFDDIFLIPTLEELIEACGDRFKSLWKHSNGKWTAMYGTRRIAPRKRVDGDTPKEAVANLWLSLNEK